MVVLSSFGIGIAESCVPTGHRQRKGATVILVYRSMARLDDGESSYETSSYGCQFQGRSNLLSQYEIDGPHSFKSLSDFKETCREFYADLVEGDMKGKSQYLGFTHVRMNYICSIDGIRSEIPKMTILYDSGEEVLIVKFMVGVPHETCAGLLARDFDRLVYARTGDGNSIGPLKSARFQGVHRMKEADDAFKPSSRILTTDWPSIAFEVGVSEHFTQLQQDARFWLECSGGQTRIVIIASVNMTTRSIVIQRWQDGAAPRQQPARNMNVPNPYARNCFATLIQTLTLEEGQVYAGASLVILAALIYDVLPRVQGAPLGPGDFEMTGGMLNSLNEFYWRLLS